MDLCRNSLYYPKIVMLNLFQHLIEIPKQVRDDSRLVAILNFEMKNILLNLTFFLLISSNAFASATVILEAENAKAELQALNKQTSTGFIGHGGKYLGEVKYVAEPGTYTLTGKTPGCPTIVETASFENEKSYRLVLTENCRIERSPI